MYPPFSPATILTDLAALVRFFSRLPVPALTVSDDPAALPAFGRAGGLTPLAGVVIALPGALLAGLLALTSLPPLVSGALVLAVLVAVTGGLHEDGLADMADGLGAGGSAERRLSVMKDSRIGASGAAALIVALLVRAAAYGAILVAGPVAAALAVIAAAAVGRGPMIALWSVLPPARNDGLSVSAGRPCGRTAAVGCVLAGTLALLAIPAAGVGGVAVGLGLAAGAAFLVGWAARRTLGGQTGDTLGACQQAAEVAFLVGLLI